MNEIVIGLIVTVVLIGLGIGLYFALRHNNTNTWTVSHQNELKDYVKNVKLFNYGSKSYGTITEEQLTCVTNDIITKLNYNDLIDLKNHTGLINNKEIINALIVLKSITNCTGYNWDKFLPKDLMDYVEKMDIKIKTPNDITCFTNFTNKIKVNYTLLEFMTLLLILDRYQKDNVPTGPILNKFDNDYSAAYNDPSCKNNTPVNPY